MRLFSRSLPLLLVALVNSVWTAGPPRITLAPKSQKVAEETKVSFFCKASGNPAPNFHWEKGTKRINTRRNRYVITEVPHLSVLRIEPVKAKRDDAVYTCVANNGQGEARANATLHVYKKVEDGNNFPSGYPRITVNPSLKSVEKGHNAIMKCEAAADPDPSILWLKDHVPVDMSDPRITLLDTGYLQIQNSQESDAGRYECVAENNLGVAYSFAAMLYVKVRRVPPHFSIPPEDTKIMPNADVNLTCVAVGSPMPYVKWREGARELTNEDEIPIGRNILQLKEVKESKNYTCIASSDLGNIEATASVIVEALPSPPTGLKVSEVTATSVKLSWESAATTPDTSYIVQFKSKHSPGARYKEKTNIGSTTYTVRHLDAFTNYEFRIVTVTKVGRGPPSNPIAVKTGELAPGSPPRNVRARAASSTTIIVSWQAPQIPNGIIEGYKVFYTLKPEKPIFFWDSQDVMNDNKLTTISGLQPNQTYTISALAYSSIGQGPMSHPIQVLTTQGVPFQPINLHADPISPNDIEVFWDAPQEVDSITSYELYYNDSHFRQNVRISINPPVEKYKLTDLTPDTVYHIQVSAKSHRGEGPRTPTIQVKTLQYVPEAPPQAVSGRFVDAHRLKVSWKPPRRDKQNGAIQGYQIFYVENDSSDNAFSDAKNETVKGDSREHEIKNLRTWTKYKIWVLAFTRVGKGPPSQPIIVQTDEDVPGEPKRVRVEAINSTAIFVEWRPPSNQNGIIRGYQVYYTEVNSNDEPIPGKTQRFQDTFDGTKHEAVITSLEPDTRYTIRVAGYTRKGDGIRSRVKIITTKGAVPTPPRNVHVDLIQEDPPRVKVTWQRPRETHGPLENYKIIWGRSGERYEEKIIAADIYSFVTYSLDKGTTYEFRVSAKNDVDYGERNVQTIKTPDGAPAGAPQNFTATGLSETSVHLTWDLPARALRNGDIVMYQITYHKLSDPINEEDLNVTDTFVDILGLEMNTDYIFTIKAYTSKGSGPWSNKLHFRTFGRMPPAPKNVKIRRTSSSIIEVTWDEPNFPVAGYRIYYNMFATPDMDVWQTLDTGPYTVAEITGLEPHTVYAVRVQAKSVDERYGNLSEVVTSDFIPPYRRDTVQNFRVTLRNSNMVKLSWDRPEKPYVNSYLLKYEGVKHYRENDAIKQVYQGPEEVRIPGQYSQWTLQNLQPKMRFDFNISVIFQDGSVGEDQHITTETLIEAPHYVHRPEIIKISKGSITLKLRRASEKNGPISHYHVIVVPQRHDQTLQKFPQDFTLDMLSRDTESVDNPAAYPYIAARFDARNLPSEFELGNGQEYEAFFNRPLDPEDQYRVFLRGYSVDPRLYTSSDYSELIQLTDDGSTIWVNPNTHRKPGGNNGKSGQNTISVGGPEEVEESNENNKLLMIVAPACGGGVFLILICAVIAFLMFRKKSSSKGAILEPESKVMVDIPPYLVDPVEMRRQHYQTPAMISHPPIPIERLAEHIDNLKANDNHKFSQEYESIEPGQQFTWDNSNLEVNKPKNRYANVIAYDHSRVILQPIDGVPGSDYINANYMDGYRKQNAYIATQGPLPETFGDFWRMVWEQRSTTIVMMTKLEERSRIKCDQYWPVRGAETYGIMHIHLVDVTELATYTIRTFQVAKYGCPEKREIRQFQFTAWPDHGVPDHPTPLLMFMRRVKSCNPPDAGPMVVHCSAGVGRTGAFIVIDAMLERIKHEKTVDIYGHVTCLRAQRNYMVQTEDQYIFIHDALAEAVQCGNTEVAARNLSVHIQKLTQPEPGETVTGMELEFKRLANVKASPNRFVSANLPVNKFKNRLVNILPYESTRVCLQPIRGVDGSDYINASFIDGYRYKKAYIATQGPLAETTEDFWRMLWEHNSTIIVMLTKLREMGREKCHQYWPSERSARYQYFVVDPMTEYNMPQYILREFKVTDARDGQSRTIRQFQFTDWPEQGVPKSGEGFIDFIGQVHKTKEQFGQEGPITVHCSAGVGRTGVFITLSIVLERMRYEGVVDMFQTVKMLRTQRPAMVQTEDQYQFNYRAALEYLGSFDHYAN
ncbi:tyrosine-protein phosphatase Lar-like isoform X2 [Gigantopelta aegis]|uniref:tyrosine-protein phosphatase Lar-like isoform X2 n=1 Tax=Gigantopelta aegis TaxID=1735272 RepID=UPI001B88A4DF|nr:tyrosine-protein phosphatase Lar-like isoform X2 [Gigantopelta aegis]